MEVWDGTAWSFTGAGEWSPDGLNHSWFFPQPAARQLPGGGLRAIWAAAYRPNGGYFPLAWSLNDTTVPGFERTQVYIDAASEGLNMLQVVEHLAATC